MGNRIEVPLSNRTFDDVTAWRAIRNAERNGIQRFQESHSQTNSDYQTPRIPVTIFQPEKSQATHPTTNRITDLNGQLSTLRQQKKAGEISPKEYRARQQKFAQKLHEEMEKRGHRPLRKKSK